MGLNSANGEWAAFECPKCHGSGEWRHGTRPGVCFLCKSKGIVHRFVRWGARESDFDVKGNWRGRMGDAPEFSCDGGWGH